MTKDPAEKAMSRIKSDFLEMAFKRWPNARRVAIRRDDTDALLFGIERLEGIDNVVLYMTPNGVLYQRTVVSWK